MEISEKCAKALQLAVDEEVTNQTSKMKQRAAALNRNLEAVRQTADSLRDELKNTQIDRDAARSRVAELEDELHKSTTMADALQTQLAAKTPKKKKKQAAPA